MVQWQNRFLSFCKTRFHTASAMIKNESGADKMEKKITSFVYVNNSNRHDMLTHRI